MSTDRTLAVAVATIVKLAANHGRPKDCYDARNGECQTCEAIAEFYRLILTDVP